MKITLNDILTFVQRLVLPLFYIKGKYLDIAIGDIVSTKEVRDLLGMASSTVVLNPGVNGEYDRSEQQDIEVLYGREGLNQIPSNSIDVLTMFSGMHHLSDSFLDMMNIIDDVMKEGSLFIMLGYDEIDMTDDSKTLSDKYADSRRSLKETMMTFGFHLQYKGWSEGPYNQYLAVFRKLPYMVKMLFDPDSDSDDIYYEMRPYLDMNKQEQQKITFIPGDENSTTILLLPNVMNGKGIRIPLSDVMNGKVTPDNLADVMNEKSTRISLSDVMNKQEQQKKTYLTITRFPYPR